MAEIYCSEPLPPFFCLFQVRLYCGTETKLTSVTEPNRCEYLFMLSTPAVCSKPDDINVDEGFEHSHTEL